MLVLLAVFGCAAPSQSPNSLWSVENYQGSFQYRYGDPQGGADMRRLFADPQHEDGGWHKTTGLSKPPGRGNAEVLWLRTRLVGPPLSRPTLHVRLSGHDLSLFVEGQPVVAQGATVTAVDRIASMGDDFLIPLGPDYVGKTLVMRLVSQAPLFGILAAPRLGDSASVAFDLVRSNGAQGLVSLLFLSLAVVGAVLFGFYRTEYAYLHFATFSFALGIWNLTFTGMLGILIPWPFPRVPTRALSIAVAFSAFCAYVGAVLGLGASRTLRWLRLLWLVVLVLFLAASFFQPRLMFRLIPPVAVLAVLTIVAWVTTAVRDARRGNIDAKLLSLGFIAVLVVMTPGILVARGTISGSVGVSFHLGTVVWGLTLAAILLRRFIAANRRTLQLQIERTLSSRRLEEQDALLQAAGNMAQGDLEKKIEVETTSSLVPLAVALDGMRQDFQAKLQLLDQAQQDLRAQVEMLETRNQEVGQLNDELRRQIEQRSRRLIDLLLPSADTPRPPVELCVGDLLGERYRIVRLLGKGGMGTVYEVERITDSRRLAAKILHSAIADRTALSRFAREAQIMARLNHQNLVAIWDVDVNTTGTLYFVMELVLGLSLWQLRDRFGDIAWSCAVLGQLAEALATLHENGVVHRDLKPENILIVQGEQDALPLVKLADFGISLLMDVERDGVEQAVPPNPGVVSVGLSAASGNANQLSATLEARVSGDITPLPRANTAPKRATPQPEIVSGPQRTPRGNERDLTSTGVIIGTPIYMAPELRFGSKYAQPAVDIFSMGVLAFEMFTGQPPFAQSPVVICSLGGELTIPPLLRTQSKLAPWLVALIERCLLTDPEERPSAAELAHALLNPSVLEK